MDEIKTVIKGTIVDKAILFQSSKDKSKTLMQLMQRIIKNGQNPIESFIWQLVGRKASQDMHDPSLMKAYLGL